MTKYENLLIEVEKYGVKVIEIDLGTKKKCGKYLSNKKDYLVVINSKISDIEKYEVLAEELGHHHTSFGNIQNQSNISNLKQEKLARRWGYEKLVGIVDIINFHNKGLRNRYELADSLNVTVEFLEEALEYYKEKYGVCFEIDDYIVYFEPNLTVLKNISLG